MSAEAKDWATPPLVEITFPPSVVDIPKTVTSEGALKDQQGRLSETLTIAQRAKRSLTDDEFSEPMARMVSLTDASMNNAKTPSKLVTHLEASSKAVQDMVDSCMALEPPPFMASASQNQNPMKDLQSIVEEFIKFKDNKYTAKAGVREDARRQLTEEREHMEQLLTESQVEVTGAEERICELESWSKAKIEEADAAIAVCENNHKEAQAEVIRESLTMESIDAQIAALMAQKDVAQKRKQRALEKATLTKTSIEKASAQKTVVENACSSKMRELGEFKEHVKIGEDFAEKGLRVVELLLESSTKHDERITSGLNQHLQDAKRSMARFFGLEMFDARVKAANAKELKSCAEMFRNTADADVHRRALEEAQIQESHCNDYWDACVEPVIHRPTLKASILQLVTVAIDAYLQALEKCLRDRDDSLSPEDLKMQHKLNLTQSIMRGFDEAPEGGEGEGSANLPGASSSLQVYSSQSGSAPASVTEEEESGDVSMVGKVIGAIFGN